MRNVFYCLQLVLVAAQGSTNTECEAKYGDDLMCKFPENINNTRKDFAVYFYPDTGGEEPLVDCGWIGEQFDCIEQEGFKCREPVSDRAVVTVPARFANRRGSYRCKTDGYRLENINPCRFNESQGKEKKVYSSCKAHTVLEGRQLIVNCTFSCDVENFSVQCNKTVVASYTKSFCGTSDVCHFGNSPHSFIVKLDTVEYFCGELRCHPDHPSPQLEVKSCRADTKMHSKTFPMVAILLPVVCVLTTITVIAVVLLLRRKWKARNGDGNQKKNVWTELPMADRDCCNGSDGRSAGMKNVWTELPMTEKDCCNGSDGRSAGMP